jgi:hypothetical protein
MWMADPHVISALREKRALVAGLIEKLERKLEQHRADLTHIDGVLRLFQPDRDPDEIRPKRTYAKRTRYFARNELARLCMDVLRDASGLVTTDEIAARVIAAKGFEAADATLRAAIRDQLLTVLRAARKRGTVEQMGLGRGLRWKMANGA